MCYRRDPVETAQCGEYLVSVYYDHDAGHMDPSGPLRQPDGCDVLRMPAQYSLRYGGWEWIAKQIDPHLLQDENGDCLDDDEIRAALQAKYVIETYSSTDDSGDVVFIGEDEDAFPTGIADEYGAWAEGYVYGFEITDPCGKVVDSCWGFIDREGFGAFALAEGLDAARVLGPAKHPITIHVTRDQLAQIERATDGDLTAWILAKIDE